MTDCTLSSLSLQWPRTAYDGGSSITGYSVEYAEIHSTVKHTEEAEHQEASESDEEDQFNDLPWKLAFDKSALRINSCTVENLLAKKLYRFRVFAHNSVGCSDGAVSEIYSPVDRKEAPSFGCDDVPTRSLTVLAGNVIR